MSTNSACSTGSVASPALINSVSQLIQTAMINPSSPNSSVLVPAQGSAQIFFNSQEGRTYKKEKQIVLEFEAKSKDLKNQLNEGIKCLEQRLDTQISIMYELQDYFKKRAEVEMQYSRDLDKLNKQILARHKSEKTKRETWHLHSTFKLWEALLNDTKQHSKYHQVASEICSKHVGDRFDEIIEDIRRMFIKCKGIGQATHEEIFKVVGELNGAMKTYHDYQSEAKQAEDKLKYVQAQKPKFEKQKSKKKLKQFEKQVEKRLHKYTDTKVKSFKARNEYILSIDSANACINKFCTDDIGDIVDCTDFGFHTSVAKCIYIYLSAQENIKRSRQLTVDQISRCIGDLDSNADKQKYLDFFQSVFNIKSKFQFEPHKGDEVSQVNAQSLIRLEMEQRYQQLDERLKTLKTENDEIFKTIEATEKSLLNYFDLKNCDMSDLFRDLNLPNHSIGPKQKRLEIEDYYVQKVRQYTTSSNLIARLEARHKMMQKALNGCVNSSDKQTLDKFNQLISMEKKKKIGKSPIIGQPRLFGGKLIEYINVTKQEIPLILTSCIRAINRLGLHNQGIFRIPGSQLEINQFKEAFEKGEDPLITVNPREMNSVAGVLKLYLRELKEPLFPKELYDTFINSLRVNANQNTANEATNTDTNTSSSPIESIEAIKIENIRKAMCQVPKPIYIILRYFFSFLNHLSEFKDENMMDAYNIAICLAPTLIPVPDDKKDQVNHQTDTIELIKLIIQNSDEVFSMECEGPVYEKFDSEIDNDEMDEVTDDEDESDKHYGKNFSDDEFYCTEAIALYDYNGRSEKELTFKKGSILAIRGQLSADWWQGSLLSPSSSATINSSTPTRIGYIPDKYIALRSSRKRIRSNASTPQTSLCQNSKTNTPSLMSTSMKDSLMSAKQPSGLASSSLNNISTPPSSRTVNEFSDIKESDILDDDNDSCSFTQYNSFRSMSIASQNTCTIPVKQRNYSTNSTLSGYSTNTQNSQLSYYTMRTAKSDEQSSLDEILSNGKKKLKMNQIEDALASVLDDMKQLDFAKQESKRPDLVIDLPINYNTPTGAKNQACRSFSLSAERSDKSDEPLKSVSTTSTESSLTSSSTSSIRLDNEKFDKKKPPPLMKKPDKSEELMKKLGKSPSETNQSECESPTGSMQSSKPALATRLSNSKATDV